MPKNAETDMILDDYNTSVRGEGEDAGTAFLVRGVDAKVKEDREIEEQFRKLPAASSFMALGESPDSEKERVAEGVRNTLLIRMQEENQKSEDEASNMGQAHVDYTSGTLEKTASGVLETMKQALMAETKALISEYGATVTPEDQSKDAVYGRALETLNTYKGQADSKGTGEDKAFYADQKKRLDDYGKEKRSKASPRFLYRSPISYSDRSAANSKKTEAINAIGNVRKAVDEWNKLLKDYHDNVYKPINDTYDRLFMAYYTMSRNVKDEKGQPDLKLRDPKAEKRIVEYRGTYEEASIAQFESAAKNGNDGIGDPYAPHVFNLIPSEPEDASTGTMDGSNMVHNMVEAEGFKGDVNRTSTEQQRGSVLSRTRYLIDKDFGVFRSRIQYNSEGKLEPDEEINTEEKLNIGDANLVIDEKTEADASIFSANTSKIYKMRTRAGGVAEGFFVAGEFVPANLQAVARQGGYAEEANFNEDYIAEREKFRTAIRQSDFFAHINDGSMKAYITYNPGELDRIDAKVFNREVSTSGHIKGSVVNSYLKILGHYREFMMFSTFIDENGTRGVTREAVQILSGFKPEGLDIIGVNIGTIAKKAMDIGKSLAAAVILINSEAIQKKDQEGQRGRLIMAAEQVMSLCEELSDLVIEVSRVDTTGVGDEIVSLVQQGVASVKTSVRGLNLMLQMSAAALDSKLLKSVLDRWKKDDKANISRIIKGTEDEKKEEPVKQPEPEIKVPEKKEPEKKESEEKEESVPFKRGPGDERYVSQFVIRWSEINHGDEMLKQVSGGTVPASKMSTKAVLAEETGLKSIKYLADLSKIYAAIDLHSMIYTKEEGSPQEIMALKMMTAFIPKGSRENYKDYKKKMSLRRIMQSLGAPGKWREVLLGAVTG